MSRRAIPTGVDHRRLAGLVAKARYHRQTGRLTTVVERDPTTGQVRLGRVERVPRGITLVLPKLLPSPNQWHWKPWYVKRGIKAAWDALIRLTATDHSAAGRRLAMATTPAGALGWMAPPAPLLARVVVTRQVAHAGQFIADDDNLHFAAKPLIDCLVDAGFLRGDSRREIDRVTDQAVSPDGQPWTVIAITVPEET
ncbi:MAG: hypothetical protein AB7R67_20100 [Vicinamibacterales bacterium]